MRWPSAAWVRYVRLKQRTWLLTLGALGVLLLAWLGTGLGMQAAYAGKALPGTEVAGVEVGGLSPADASERLAGAELRRDKVTLAYEGQRFSVSRKDTGSRVDVAATVERTMSAGRHGPLTWIWPGPLVLWGNHDVMPAVRIDKGRLSDVAASIAQRVDRRVFYGNLSIDADSLRVRVKQPRPGRKVDQQATAAAIRTGLRHPGHSVRQLPVRNQAVPDHQLEKLEALAKRTRAYLEKPLRLTAGDTSVTVSPRQLAPALTVKGLGSEDTRRLRLGVSRKELSTLLDSIAGQVSREPVNAQMSAPARPVTLDRQQGLTWEPRAAQVSVQPGRSGRTVKRKATAGAIAAAVRKGKHAADLPVRKKAPEIPTKAARQVDSLIGTFTTYHACCEPRVTNIHRMAATVDGTVIMPGEQFSLNGVVGERTRAKGYVPAPYIFRGKLVPDVGGGVSQFSTTTYNAAYFAGLPIEDHQAHSYYISRYPPGRESTLNYPTIDLVWTNNTDAPILVRAATTDTSVTVSLYGDNGGRTVASTTGPKKNWPQGDFKITVSRTITYGDGQVERHAETTHYDKPPKH